MQNINNGILERNSKVLRAHSGCKDPDTDVDKLLFHLKVDFSYHLCLGLLVLSRWQTTPFLRTLAYCQIFYNASSYKYLPSPNQPQYGSNHGTFHKYAAEINTIPHHVLIVYSAVYCSGSLVGSRIVVTAASCFERRTDNASVIVKVGSSSVTEIGQVIEALELKTHEYFGHDTNRNNDIAIMILKENVIFGENVKKIVLVETGMAIHVGTVLEVSGWGSTNLKPKFFNVLLWSEMVLIDNYECNTVYPHRMTSSNFCVRYQPDRKLSDNGGPAVYDEMLVGIVSSGAAKSQEPYIAVLTNISYFNRWIVLNSKRLLDKYCVPYEYTEYSHSEYDSGVLST